MSRKLILPPRRKGTPLPHSMATYMFHHYNPVSKAAFILGYQDVWRWKEQHWMHRGVPVPHHALRRILLALHSKEATALTARSDMTGSYWQLLQRPSTQTCWLTGVKVPPDKHEVEIIQIQRAAENQRQRSRAALRLFTGNSIIIHSPHSFISAFQRECRGSLCPSCSSISAVQDQDPVSALC